MMDLVTLILVLTFTQNVTRLSTALAQRLESSAPRTWAISSHGAHPRQRPTQRREHRGAR
jgi:hypothetical protein